MKRYGITVTEEGLFAYAKIAFSKKKGWYLEKYFKWDTNSFLRNYLLLDKSVMLGLPCHWMRLPTEELQEIKIIGEENSFKLCIKESEFKSFTELLKNNIAKVYPDDVFLATIPLCFGKDVPASFVSIFKDSKCVKIGIIIQKKLYYVLNVKACSYRSIDGYIAIIERYFKRYFPDLSFPERIYIIGEATFENIPQLGINYITPPIKDSSVLKAVGCALGGVSGDSPQFEGGSKEFNYRIMRTFLLYASTSLIVIIFLFILFLLGLNLKLKKELNIVRNNYNTILSENKEIKKMLDISDSLSNKITRLNSIISKQKKWGIFLHFIGKERLKEIYYERLGSEVVSGTNNVRVAIAGWSENEKSVTDFVKKLNDSQIVSKVTISSIERIKETEAACRFKIVCIISN